MAGRGTTTQKERFSRAFLVAAAGAAGYTLSWTQDDEDGVDCTVRDGGITVDFQLKATSAPKTTPDGLVFDLDVATYRKLSGVRTSPGFLLVSVLPTKTWLTMDSTSTSIYSASYFLDLTDASPTTNRSRIRVRIPYENLLTEQSLVAIMKQARERVIGLA